MNSKLHNFDYCTRSILWGSYVDINFVTCFNAYSKETKRCDEVIK